MHGNLPWTSVLQGARSRANAAAAGREDAYHKLNGNSPRLLRQGAPRVAARGAENGEGAKDLYVAFTAKSAGAVRACYKAAMNAGATSNKEPSLRPEWRADYFAANIGDPDGYNIEIAYKPWLYKSASNVDLVRN